MVIAVTPNISLLFGKINKPTKLSRPFWEREIYRYQLYHLGPMPMKYILSHLDHRQKLFWAFVLEENFDFSECFLDRFSNPHCTQFERPELRKSVFSKLCTSEMQQEIQMVFGMHQEIQMVFGKKLTLLRARKYADKKKGLFLYIPLWFVNKLLFNLKLPYPKVSSLTNKMRLLLISLSIHA